VIQSHEELEVYRMAFEAAMRIFELSRQFPREGTYSLTDQFRRSSRSVAAISLKRGPYGNDGIKLLS